MSTFRHVGLVVQELRRAQAFYQQVFGLTVVSEQVEIGPYIDTLVSIDQVEIHWVKLGDGSGFLLELLCYRKHPDPPASVDAPYPAFRHGCSHVAFTVPSIDDTYPRVTEAGGRFLSPIQFSPDGRVRVAYCSDPEGILFEVVEEQKR